MALRTSGKSVRMRTTSVSVSIFAFGAITMLSLLSCSLRNGGEVESITYELEERSSRGPLEVVVRAEKKEMSLADLNRVEVEARIDPGYEVKFGDLLDGFQKVIVRDFDEGQPIIGADGKKVVKRNYVIEALYSGETVIDPFEVRFVKARIAVDGAGSPGGLESSEGGGLGTGEEDREVPSTDGENDEAGEEYVCETSPVSFQVTSISEAEGGIPDIKGPKGTVPLLDETSVPWGWMLGVPIVLLLAAIAFFLWRRRSPPEVKKVRIPPHDLAYAELRQLREDDLIEQGLFEEFYVRLSGILRRYIEGRFGLRAPERTTEEFLVELSRYPKQRALTDAHRKALEQFLVHTDLVKFAALTPSTEDIQRSFDLAKNFVEETKDTRQMEAA